MKKILICGGHPTPALAVVDALKKEHPTTELLFVGRKYAIESERTLSYEYKGCQLRGVRFLELQAGRITRLLTKSSILNMLYVPYGFLQGLFILLQEQPDAIVSFGGYIALPLAFWGWVLGKKVVTHEQTMKPGSANKLIGRFSEKIFVAFESVVSEFPKDKTEWIGNPVREVVFEKNELPFSLDESVPLLYVTGGSLGSHSINAHIFTLLPELLKRFAIIHQTGDIKEYGDFEKALALAKECEGQYPKRYIPVSHLSEFALGTIYDKSEFIIGRSGANTFFELIALQKPALFIPLPWSANGEQKAHADFFVKNHMGEEFDQKNASSELLKKIDGMHAKIKTYKRAFSSLPLQLKRDAAYTLVKALYRS
jgi:UDP-N-acetylglucosamine--N-acetylmuramyl-(pentapeptide) pyrophosphoryl-undecaprenol N-acetylglucosamine transferase